MIPRNISEFEWKL